MPELPEVEILARQIRQHVVGRTVQSVSTTPDQALESGGERLLELHGRSLAGVRRFGKRLSLDFSGGLSLLTHLMMVGQWRFSALTGDCPPAPRLTITFTDGTRLLLHGVALRFQQLLPTQQVAEQESIRALGPDALSPEFTAESLAEGLAGRRAAVKAVLLEQGLIGGIGNTYADEALFLAGVHPRRQSSDLSREEVDSLYQAVVRVMREAIEHGGASEMAFVHLDGSKGRYQEFFHVKEREGQVCPVCGATIAKDKVAGRPTYFCPGHQRL